MGHSLMVAPQGPGCGLGSQRIMVWKLQGRRSRKDPVQPPRSVVQEGQRENWRRLQEKQSPRKSASFPSGPEGENQTQDDDRCLAPEGILEKFGDGRWAPRASRSLRNKQNLWECRSVRVWVVGDELEFW